MSATPVSHPYGVRDVERLLGLTRAHLRPLVESGFVSPARGPRREWLFSFQDLIVLRAAQALVAASVPRRRITHSLRELRRQLPAQVPLSGLSIGAVGDRVVVREGSARWQAESGQYLLAFDVEPAPRAAARISDSHFEQGIEQEAAGNVDAALAEYARAISDEPGHLEAHINYALLLQERGRPVEAERAYRAAIAACGPVPSLYYNYALLLEDESRLVDAVRAYLAALRADPDFADAHYNLALIYEKAGRRRDAIRHMSKYRRLGGADTS